MIIWRSGVFIYFLNPIENWCGCLEWKSDWCWRLYLFGEHSNYIFEELYWIYSFEIFLVISWKFISCFWIFHYRRHLTKKWIFLRKLCEFLCRNLEKKYLGQLHRKCLLLCVCVWQLWKIKGEIVWREKMLQNESPWTKPLQRKKIWSDLSLLQCSAYDNH